jgi:hypothetical protein
LEDVWIEEILLCAKGDEGNEIMREMGAKTMNLKDPLEYSPWIIVNGQRNSIAQNDLQKVICDNLLVINFSIENKFLELYSLFNSPKLLKLIIRIDLNNRAIGRSHAVSLVLLK